MNSSGNSWQGFLNKNSYFISGFLLFSLVCIVLLSTLEQGEAVVFFSENRSWFGDQFFKYATKLGEAGVYLVALFVLLFIRWRYALMVPLLGLVVTLVSFISKKIFAHDRPFLYFRKQGLFEGINPVDGVILNGGSNSFPSGHAMAAFALFAFLAFCLPYKKGVGSILVLCAIMASVSRVYLVQHFVKDIFMGAILGMFLAGIFYYLQDHLSGPFSRPWLDDSLLTRRNPVQNIEQGITSKEPQK